MIGNIKLLSKKDLVSLMTIAYETLSCKDLDSFNSIVLGVLRLTPFEYSVCAHGDIIRERVNKQPDLFIVDVSYPDSYVKHYIENEYHVTDPIIYEYITRQKPINWSRSINCKSAGIEYVYSIDAHEFQFKDGWTFGDLEQDFRLGSLFWIGGPSCDHSKRTQAIIEYIVPFLSQTLKQIASRFSTNKVFRIRPHRLTSSELEVLKWLKEGKTTWEISVIMNRSERTIKFHVDNIKNKLNAVNRTQAVVIALREGIISF